VLHHTQDRRGWLRISRSRSMRKPLSAGDRPWRKANWSTNPASRLGRRAGAAGRRRPGRSGGAGRGGSPKPCAEIGLAKDFRAEGVGDNEPGLERRELDRRRFGNREVEPVAVGGVIAPLAVGAEIAGEDLISTISTSPSLLTPTMSARRPSTSGSSVTLEKPRDRRSRRTPRAIVAAVSDWRPSGGRTSRSPLIITTRRRSR
jgi:hypothetical protein